MLSASMPLTLALSVSGIASPYQTADFEVPAAPYVRVRNGSGEVRITAKDVSKIQVQAKIVGDGVEIDRRRVGDAFVLETQCPRLRFFGKCSVDYQIAVPRQTSVDVKTGSGEISITGTEGAAALKAGSGDIEIATLVGPELDIKVGSGDISIDGSNVRVIRFRQGSGSFKADRLRVHEMNGRTSSGRLLAALVGPPPARVDIKSGSGDVQLKVPRIAYNVDVKTGSGDVEMHRVEVDKKSDHSIEVKTGSGDVEIIGRATDDPSPSSGSSDGN